ncbi:MAG: TlpA disulfide reductase family protein [Gammaproteobacteria bacterium]
MIQLTTLAARAEPVDFSRTSLSGEEFRLSDHRGKWVVINFWATYCGPCLRELPMLARFHRTHKDKDAVVVGVNFEVIEEKALRAFVEKLDIPFPIVQVGDTPLIPFEPLERGLPETFFVSPDGEYVDKHIGELSYQDILDFTGLTD